MSIGTSRPVTRRRKSSRRVNFIPPLLGPRASWEHVLQVSRNPKDARDAAHGAHITYRKASDLAETPSVCFGPVAELADIPVASLAPVRRPTAYKGMPNYIGRVAMWNEFGPDAVWIESLNELGHVKDLCLTEPVRSLMTQPVRIEFAWMDGVRSHVPDFLVELVTGQRVLIDVTRSRATADEQRSATWALTAAVARTLGMRYEVRTELPEQRVKNLSFLWCHRRPDGDRDAVFREVVAPRLPLTISAASRALGGGPLGQLQVWEGIAAQEAVVQLDLPIDPWTKLYPPSTLQGPRPWVATQ